jgi:valyl-tRNA synthetase
MIMFSLYFHKEVPFKTLYFHGLVLNEQGRKMSKSKGTGIDPIPMTEKYGTDTLRLSLVVGTAPGLDFRMSEAKISGQRNFCNKLWNVSRYVLTQSSPPARGGDTAKPRGGGSTLADRWILVRLNETTATVTRHLEQFQFSLAVEELQQFLWKDFADWYVEIHKVEGNTRLLRAVLRQYLILLHPFAPFITEAIWCALGEKKLLMIESWPKTKKLNAANRASTKEFRNFQRLIMGFRNLRIHGALNQSLSVQPTAKLNGELVLKLTGVSFTDQLPTESARLTVAGEQFMVNHTIAEQYTAWCARERAQIKQYIDQKRRLANNKKAPEQIRKKAQEDSVEAESRLTDFD